MDKIKRRDFMKMIGLAVVCPKGWIASHKLLPPICDDGNWHHLIVYRNEEGIEKVFLDEVQISGIIFHPHNFECKDFHWSLLDRKNLIHGFTTKYMSEERFWFRKKQKNAE